MKMLSCMIAVLAVILLLSSSPDARAQANTAGEQPRSLAPRVWPSKPPQDCPFEPSKDITGVAFTGRCKTYTNADTWYPSWASDGNLYSPWTDGRIGEMKCTSLDRWDLPASTGQAKIVGDDPMNLQIVNRGTHPGSPKPYGGRYPCGSLVHNGIWYYGTYCLDMRPKEYNWGTLGPLVGFRISRDYGQTWVDSPCAPAQALFGESGKDGSKVKIGAPHFVDFGKNMEHSPDGKAYLVGHGAVDPDAQPRPANLSWISGDQIYITRVTPSPENINDATQYEFFAGHDASGRAVWTHDFSKIEPIVDWNNRCGCVTMTYNPPLEKYLMCITDGWPTIKTMDTYILESSSITGPWKRVTFMAKFGEQAYFVNIPSKFIGKNGRKVWLCYSGNFTRNQKVNPPGGRYAMSLQEMVLLKDRKAGGL